MLLLHVHVSFVSTSTTDHPSALHWSCFGREATLFWRYAHRYRQGDIPGECVELAHILLLTLNAQRMQILRNTHNSQATQSAKSEISLRFAQDLWANGKNGATLLERLYSSDSTRASRHHRTLRGHRHPAGNAPLPDP